MNTEKLAATRVQRARQQIETLRRQLKTLERTLGEGRAPAYLSEMRHTFSRIEIAVGQLRLLREMQVRHDSGAADVARVAATGVSDTWLTDELANELGAGNDEDLDRAGRIASLVRELHGRGKALRIKAVVDHGTDNMRDVARDLRNGR